MGFTVPEVGVGTPTDGVQIQAPPRRGHAAPAVRTRDDAQHLVDGDPPVVEAVGRRRHVQQPDTGSSHPDFGHGRVPVLLEVRHPGPQRLGVVLTKGFDVAHLEAGLLHGQDDLAHVDELAIGEHVAADERSGADPRAAHTRDGVVEQPALWLQKPAHGGEVLRALRGPDVLEHADGGDAVERPVPHVPIVLQPDLDLLLQSGSG